MQRGLQPARQQPLGAAIPDPRAILVLTPSRREPRQERPLPGIARGCTRVGAHAARYGAWAFVVLVSTKIALLTELGAVSINPVDSFHFGIARLGPPACSLSGATNHHAV